MNRLFALVFAAFAVASFRAPTVLSQSPPLMVDIMKDVDAVHMKMVALAKAMPDDKYTWRPSVGVRSVGEVFLHVASDNYLLPGMMGAVAPASTGIDAKKFETAVAFEKKGLSRDATVAALEDSFAFLKLAMQKTTGDGLMMPVDMFGQKATQQGLWVLTMTHLHEHLGQAIAYARVNGVTPPWSK